MDKLFTTDVGGRSHHLLGTFSGRILTTTSDLLGPEEKSKSL